MNADDLVADYQCALQKQAAMKSAEAYAEDKLKIVLAEQVTALDMAVSKAEYAARASKPYKDAVDILATARGAAADAAATVEYLRVRWETWRTKMSMQKVMRQTNG